MKLSHAIILAAGLGTRMRPLTETMPKPLIPVAGKPLIDWCLDWVGEAGITQVVVNSSYLADQLEAHLAQRVSPGLRISREEPVPLETGGGIKKALPMLREGPFLAMNSDAVFPPQSGEHPLQRMQAAWNDGLDFLMLLIPVVSAIGWQGNGDFVMEADGRIRRPRSGEAAPYIFSGVEIIHPRVFDGVPEGAFSLSKLWNARMGEDGCFNRIGAVVHAGDWLNVGDLPGLQAATEYLLR